MEIVSVIHGVQRGTRDNKTKDIRDAPIKRTMFTKRRTGGELMPRTNAIVETTTPRRLSRKAVFAALLSPRPA